MLAPKLVVFAFVISTGVLGRGTSKGNAKSRQAADEYGYNHPPIPENYEPIPVSVVYENDNNREDKSLKNIDSPNHIAVEINTEQTKPESTVIIPKVPEANNNDEFEIKKPTKTDGTQSKVTTYRPQREYQIPVAIVYEPESTNYQKPRPNSNRITNKRRRTQKPASDDKLADEDGNIQSGDDRIVQVNGHTGPGLGLSSNKKVENKRRNDTRPGTENTNIFKDNQPSSSISNKAKESNKSQTTQKPTAEKAKISSVDKISSDTIVNKKDKLNTNDEIQPETKKIADQNRKPSRSQENVNDSVIPKVERSKQVPTDGDQNLRKHDNSTRVREVIPIVQSENVVFSHSGNFKYSYEGGDGTKAFEAGELKTFDDETAGEAVRGGFSYTAKDGNEYSLSYTADENGYRPVGAHLPTPPPIPPAIARALAYLATKTTPAPVTESIAESDQ